MLYIPLYAESYLRPDYSYYSEAAAQKTLESCTTSNGRRSVILHRKTIDKKDGRGEFLCHLFLSVFVLCHSFFERGFYGFLTSIDQCLLKNSGFCIL